MGLETLFLGIAILALVVALSHAELMVYTQDAWKAAGGNPGIQATRPELFEALEAMNEAEDAFDIEREQLLKEIAEARAAIKECL